MTIARILESRQPGVVCCEADCTVADAIAKLADRRIGAMPIIEGGQVLGIFSERDVVYRLREFGERALQLPVRKVMTSPALTVSPDTEVIEALSLMTMRRIRHLPVMSNGELVDFISIGDLVKFRMDRIENEARAMRNYIRTA